MIILTAVGVLALGLIALASLIAAGTPAWRPPLRMEPDLEASAERVALMQEIGRQQEERRRAELAKWLEPAEQLSEEPAESEVA
jgi:hypothetical protein